MPVALTQRHRMSPAPQDFHAGASCQGHAATMGTGHGMQIGAQVRKYRPSDLWSECSLQCRFGLCFSPARSGTAFSVCCLAVHSAFSRVH